MELNKSERDHKMDQAIKKLWCDALRSGKYKQGHGGLKIVMEEGEDYSYCCLGVLCEVYRTTVSGSEQWMDGGPNQLEYLGRVDMLPSKVAMWADLQHCRLPDPEIDGSRGGMIAAMDALAEMNDDPEEKYKFEDLAGIIHNYL